MKNCRSYGIFLGIGALAFGCAHATVRAPTSLDRPQLDLAFASRAVALSLHCVDTESPHWEDKRPEFEKGKVKERHPAFYGCLDWHSAAHGHWAMLRALDALPTLPEKAAILEKLSRHLTPQNILGEVAFLKKNPKFEQPYGWGWGLALAAELRASLLPEARAWQRAFVPLEELLEQRMRKYLRDRKRPSRVGLHDSSAYAMKHAWDFAVAAGRADFQREIEKRARDFFLRDRHCPLAYEPGDTDFLSPCLEEADLMRRVLPVEEFRPWFSAFLPEISPDQLKPVVPEDLHDPYEVHLVGLMFSKASAISGVAERLAQDDPRRAILLGGVQALIEEGGKLMFESDYGGTHWLASFAIYYYTGAGL